MARCAPRVAGAPHDRGLRPEKVTYFVGIEEQAAVVHSRRQRGRASSSTEKPAGGDVGVVVGVVHRPRSRSLSVSGEGKAPGADQARRLTSSTEADWGGRSHGGPGHGVALPAAGRGWALSRAQ